MADDTHDMLVDQLLPDFDATIIEHIVVDAPPDVVFRTAREIDFMEIRSPMTDAAMHLRNVPARLGRAIGRSDAPPPPPAMRLADMFDEGVEPVPGLEEWVGLGEVDGSEIIFGAIGKVWKPNIEWASISPEEFRDFHEPDYAKIAAVFSVRPYGSDRTLLSYETRTAGTDPEAGAKFLRYWGLVSRFVRYVLRAAITTIKDLAEEGSMHAEEIDIRDDTAPAVPEPPPIVSSTKS